MSQGADRTMGVDSLRTRIAEIVADRQDLRSSGASRESLEENRRQLLHSQSELSRALIQQHLGADAPA